MFTGIIEELGKVRQITNNKIIVECCVVLDKTKLGDSIAINGVCLTVTELTDKTFTADVSAETFKVTNFSSVKTGDYVNLERALKLEERLGGHIVSGHIDGIGKIITLISENNFYNLEVELNETLAKHTVKKGSISINGISLTIAEIDKNIIKIAVIPHTYQNTNLKHLQHGDFVNIETDILAKYVEKFLSTSDNRSNIDLKFLQENGF